MHKNINKIINTVLIGYMLGSTVSVFAIENKNTNNLVNEFGLSTLAENSEEVAEHNYEYKGPFIILSKEDPVQRILGGDEFRLRNN